MNIHVFLHDPMDGLGIIEDWLNRKGFNYGVTKFYEEYIIPDVKSVDFLIVMGGPMGVYEEDQYPWLKAEKLFIRTMLEQKKKVLGICLGAQLIASAMGAKVFRNKHKEIGWFPIRLNAEAFNHSLFSGLPATLDVLHWHGDTFDLPQDAVCMASSEACINQAFVVDNHVLALQFHFETTEKSLNEMIIYGNDEITEGPYIQSIRQITDGIGVIKNNNAIMLQLLDKFYKI